MRSLIPVLLLTLLTGSVMLHAQTPTAAGTIVVKGLGVKGKDRAKKPLARKRFYLFRGGLGDNQSSKMIKSIPVVSRDCFYAGLKASPCFIAWLREENCETPFCRVIKREDISGVREFQTAYDKGLALYGPKPDVALNWLLNNMPGELVSGYYRQQKGVVDKVLAGQTLIQSSMTTSTAAEATFVGVTTADKPTKYTITNLLPVEIDDKSYVWACEVDVQRNKIASIPIVLNLDPKKKNCVQYVNELRSCTTEACNKK